MKRQRNDEKRMIQKGLYSLFSTELTVRIPGWTSPPPLRNCNVPMHVCCAQHDAHAAFSPNCFTLVDRTNCTCIYSSACCRCTVLVPRMERFHTSGSKLNISIPTAPGHVHLRRNLGYIFIDKNLPGAYLHREVTLIMQIVKLHHLHNISMKPIVHNSIHPALLRNIRIDAPRVFTGDSIDVVSQLPPAISSTSLHVQW